MTEIFPPELEVVACPVAEIDALLALAQQYYLEDHLEFDPARFKHALTAAITLERGSAWWLCAHGERVGYALMIDRRAHV